jgi:hypothetical protein
VEEEEQYPGRTAVGLCREGREVGRCIEGGRFRKCYDAFVGVRCHSVPKKLKGAEITARYYYLMHQ